MPGQRIGPLLIKNAQLRVVGCSRGHGMKAKKKKVNRVHPRGRDISIGGGQARRHHMACMVATLRQQQEDEEAGTTRGQKGAGGSSRARTAPEVHYCCDGGKSRAAAGKRAGSQARSQKRRMRQRAGKNAWARGPRRTAGDLPGGARRRPVARGRRSALADGRRGQAAHAVLVLPQDGRHDGGVVWAVLAARQAAGQGRAQGRGQRQVGCQPAAGSGRHAVRQRGPPAAAGARRGSAGPEQQLQQQLQAAAQSQPRGAAGLTARSSARAG